MQRRAARISVLVAKALRESRSTIGWLCGGMFAVVYLGALIVPPLHGAVSQLAHQIPMVNQLVAASLGTQTHERLTMHLMLGLLWAHPVVLALAWAPALALCTRYPAGEVGEATIDVLLSWPITRLEIAAAEAIAWIGTGLGVHLAALGGWCLGAGWGPTSVLPDPSATLKVLGCLFASLLAVGGFASLVSAWSDRRGRAQGIIFGVVFVSYLLGVLAPLWPPASALRPLSLLAYYEPGAILTGGSIPGEHLRTLLLVALICETAALHRMATRPLSTT
jgi:hypothetical protein